MTATVAKRATSPSRMFGENTAYSFIDKDPIIDVLRTACGLSSKSSSGCWHILKQLEEKSGVSASTLWGWFFGDTISPRYCSVAAVVRALGIIARIGEYPKGRRTAR